MDIVEIFTANLADPVDLVERNDWKVGRATGVWGLYTFGRNLCAPMCGPDEHPVSWSVWDDVFACYKGKEGKRPTSKDSWDDLREKQQEYRVFFNQFFLFENSASYI